MAGRMTLFAEQSLGSYCPDLPLEPNCQFTGHTFISGLPTFLIVLFGRLIYYCTMLKASKIEHPYTTICATANKNVDAVGAETDIEDFFIMSN